MNHPAVDQSVRTGDRLLVEADVAVVGAGPVGLITAILLANKGHQVALIERWPAPYDLPRATGITHEILRCLQVADLIDDVRDDLLFTEDGSRKFEMRAGTGEVLTVRIDKPMSASGWPERASFSQPQFERTLNIRATAHPGIRLLRGWNATSVTDDETGATVFAQRWQDDDTGALEVRARYVIGSDGANSVVRAGELDEVCDLEFAHEWLVVDVVLPPERVITPHVAQIFGPPRPTTLVSGGPGGRRRWEFMRLENESVDELNSAETAWRLLEPFDVRPDNAVLERHAVYTYQGLYCLRWRSGRRVLAGDAAHLMPVFLGEGFNSGIRDAAGLAWRLDLILRGVTTDKVLDAYVAERLGHVRQVIDMAIEAGKVICILDPDRAAARDARMRADPHGWMAEDKRRDWRLGEGMWRRSDAEGGYLGMQGRVEIDGVVGLFDDVLGHHGFVLVGVDGDPDRHLSSQTRQAWERIGGMTAHVGADAAILDVDGTYADWFAAKGIGLALFRPDFYVFGTSESAADADALVSQLLRELGVLDLATT